jgi:glycosyltransferase involved in cell wall biosynthesis
MWSIHYSITSLAGEKKLTAAVIRLCAFLSKLADQVIFVSRASQAQHTLLGYSPEKGCVIPNGINVEEFISSDASRASVRAELGLADDAFLIGLMGRYHPMKDHANFLRAAASIAKQQPAIQFLMIGRGVDGENPILRGSIEDLGLTRQTHLLGERDDIPRLAAALDIFSLSSACESFPNVIGEAMACEVPAVVTNVGDAAWIVGNTGRVVPPCDPGALAAAWNEMIDFGPAGRMAMGRAARMRVVEHFTLESVAARYDALYESVLARAVSGDFARRTPALANMTNLNATVD